MKNCGLLLVTALILPAAANGLLAQGTAFTYQGQLNVSGSPANGKYDFTFGLFGGSTTNSGQAGSTLTNLDVGVTNGLFTVAIDFGSNFPGASRWLAIAVRTNGGTNFTALSPLQELTPTPYAIYAPNAGIAASAGSVAGTNITGMILLSQLPAMVVTNGASGVSVTGTFTGNGAGLTNVSAASLAIPFGMVFIPAGTFTMGDTLDGETDAIPAITISVSSYYMDANLVSGSLWLSVFYWATNHGYTFVNGGYGRAANQPIQTLDWYDTVKWCNARSQQAGLTPVYYTDTNLTLVYTNGEVTPYPNWTVNGYRLPTEAEWEKVARGGLSGQRFPWGLVINQGLANYFGDTAYSYDSGPNGFSGAVTNGIAPYTSPISYYAPNGYGLYDMAGNVFAWCWDWYGTPYGQPTTNNPTGPSTGANRVTRGGSWDSYAISLRCADRTAYNPTNTSEVVGFRCVRGH